MFFWKKVSIFAQNDYLHMKNRRQFPSLCRYFFLSYPTKKGGFLFLPVLQGFKTPARTPYIVKLYAKIFISMFACPFSLQKSYPFFLSLFWVFSVLSVVFCIKKTLRPFWSEKPFLSFLWVSSIIFGKSFPKKENTSYFKYFRKEFPSILIPVSEKSFPKKEITSYFKYFGKEFPSQLYFLFFLHFRRNLKQKHFLRPHPKRRNPLPLRQPFQKCRQQVIISPVLHL